MSTAPSVAASHRFLSHPSSKSFWVLSGQIYDWFYHHRVQGCLTLRQTLEQWGLCHEAQITITFGRSGQLDFSGNPDPQAAQAQFAGQGQRRPPKYGQQRPTTPPSPTQTDELQAVAAAEEAAGGESQALLNTLQRLGQWLQNSTTSSLILIEGFHELYEGLQG